jgi:hypothetical protein
MSAIPLFSAEISLYGDPDEGLRIECSEKHSEAIKRCLVSAGFQCGTQKINIPGTSTIHNWVEFNVSGGSFDSMKKAISNCLHAAGVTVAEESFSSAEDLSVRLNLTNISVFDK